MPANDPASPQELVDNAAAIEALADAGKPHVTHLPISYREIAAFAMCIDFLLISGAAVVSSSVYQFFGVTMAGELSRDFATAVFVAAIFVSATWARKLYNPEMLTRWHEQFQNLAGAWCGTFFLLASGVFAWGVGKELSRGTVLLFWGIGGCMLLVHRAFWRFFLPRALSKGSLRGRNAVVITWDSPLTQAISTDLSRHGYIVTHRFVLNSNAEKSSATLLQAVNALHGKPIDDIFLIPPLGQDVDIGGVARQLRVFPVPVTLLPDEATAALIRNPWYELGSSLAVEVQGPPLSPAERALKRGFDIIFSALVLLALSPLFVLVALAVKLETRGPAFFIQTRHGFNGQPFRIFKFRTMSVLEDGAVVTQARKDDHRVTRVGAWLRKSSIDEMPQFLNVLIGDMSVVGPRPHASAHDDYFLKCVENYAFRSHVKSGITGWAQVRGARGITDTIDKIQTRVDLDLWYIKHWSFALDLSIIIRTIGVIIIGKNAV